MRNLIILFYPVFSSKILLVIIKTKKYWLGVVSHMNRPKKHYAKAFSCLFNK